MKVNLTPETESEIKKVVDELLSGHIILYPTDTIWGIGCDATNSSAITKIFQIKKRSPSKSMIILVDSPAMIEIYTDHPSAILVDAMINSSTPTTAIFKNAKNLPPNLVNTDGSIAMRIASDPFCQEILQAFGKPVVSTSANISNGLSPQNFSQIDPALKEEVDYAVFYRRDDNTKKDPSHIIRLNEHNEVERIR